MKTLMAGIDLHSNNLVIGLVDAEGKRLLHRKLDCELKKVLELLAPYKEQLHTVAGLGPLLRRGEDRHCDPGTTRKVAAV